MSSTPASRRRGIALTVAVVAILGLVLQMGLRQSVHQAAEAAIPTLTLSQEIALGQAAAPSHGFV